jgi:hypothetical protein
MICTKSGEQVFWKGKKILTFDTLRKKYKVVNNKLEIFFLD